MAFDVPKKNGRFSYIWCQRSKEKETSIPLWKDSESQKKRKVIPANFQKLKEEGTFVGVKDQRKRDG